MFAETWSKLGLWTAAAYCAAACGTAQVAPAGADGATGGEDTILADLTAEDTGKLPLEDGFVDVATPDVAAAVDTAIDALSADIEAKCPGAPGCSCKENADCDNAQCLETGSGKVCATPCVDKCADGYKCTLVNSGGGDPVTICVPKYVHLCDPCVKSKDCQTLGSSDAACVNEASQGNFCGTACGSDGDCAAGYGCQSVNSVEGAKVQQCVKTSTAPELKFGQCVCTDLAVAQKAQTNCFVEHKNDKGELVGKCAGVRACGASGLTTCAAPALDVEVCDGKDNNCDGKTDENTCNSGGVCNVGTCDPQTGCQYNKLNNVPCDADKNACTENDQCKQGICVPGPGKICDDGNPCTADSCDPASGCTKTADDGKLCDADGNACTLADHCEGSTCTAGKPVVCDNTNPCSKASCDAISGKCVGKSLQDGAPCEDGTVCTQGDVCKTGECLGKIVSCDDNNPCTGNSCDPITGCGATNLDGLGCDDDNPCTIGDLCKAGACVKGATKPCDSGASCVAGACSLTTGKCEYKNKSDDAACNDGDGCTANDSCGGGVCQGKGLNCDDSNPCSNDSCDKITGCVHIANVSPCSDGDACTQSDGCANSLCASGPKKICDDGVLCTADSCDKASGVCVFNAVGMNGFPCDDGNGCTLGDNCKNGICSIGIAKDCNDNNVCTDDLCDKVKGCTVFPNSKPCSDGNACTKNDTCAFGDCEGVTLNCNDGNVCTDEGCDAKKGCIFNNTNALCDDGNKCTKGDVCAAGKCAGPVGCSAAGVCAQGNSCVCKQGYSGDGFSCDDINECVKGLFTCPANTDCNNTIGSYTCPCKVGFGDCNNNVVDGCEHDVSGDMNNCGQCGNVCTVLQTCASNFCVDLVPPVVNDGSLVKGTDLFYQYSPLVAGFINANWNPIPKATSYQVAVGTTPGGVDIAAYADVGNVTSVSVKNLALAGAWNSPKVYYVSVKAVAGVAVGKPFTSNGVRIAEAATWTGTVTGLRPPDALGGYTQNWPTGGMLAVYGKHYFETVTIAQGASVNVQGWGKVDNVQENVAADAVAVTAPKDGWLELYANNITVNGTITASGRGYGGGGAGGATCGDMAPRGHGGNGGLGGEGGNGDSNGCAGGGGGGGGAPFGPSGSSDCVPGGMGSLTGGGGGSSGQWGCDFGAVGGDGGVPAGAGDAGGVGDIGGSPVPNQAGAGSTGGAGEFSDGGGGGGGIDGVAASRGGGGGGGYGAGGGGDNDDNGVAGAGPFAGAGGATNNPADNGAPGGYAAPGANGDLTKDHSLLLGSGGGGGGGSESQAGGGGGAAGGGYIKLFGKIGLTIGATAKLLANGAGGGGGSCDDDDDSRIGGIGGAGAGGGILLDSAALIINSIGTSFSARGGTGDLTIGGTIKLFYTTLVGTKPAQAGRIYDAGAGSFVP